MPAAATRCRRALLFPLLVGVALACRPAAAETTPPEGPTEPTHVGFELGEFRLRDYRPVQGGKVRLAFTLHASVEAEAADVFEKRLERSRMRVRDQVITAMRLADPEEFEDPQLRLVRRRLYLRLRRALPDLAMEEVYFSDFRYFVK